jgi:multiple sugar transport system permease protein
VNVSQPVTTARAARQARHISLAERLDRGFQYWALLPALLVLLALTVFPLVELLGMSVSTVSFAQGQVIWTFSGLDNLMTFLQDNVFLIAIGNTVLFVIVTVALETLLGLGLAILISQIRRWSGLTRALLMIPILVPGIAIGTIWSLMYNYEIGVFDVLLRLVGLPAQSWTGNPNLALPSIMIVDIWHWTSFIFLLMLAGLESLPVEPIEAARVDGATGWQVLRYIILPLMRPTILVAVLFRTIFAFKVFDEVFLLTGGGPGTASEVVSLYIYQVFFPQSRMGYGALLSVVTIVITMSMVLFYLRSLRRRSDAA